MRAAWESKIILITQPIKDKHNIVLHSFLKKPCSCRISLLNSPKTEVQRGLNGPLLVSALSASPRIALDKHANMERRTCNNLCKIE